GLVREALYAQVDPERRALTDGAAYAHLAAHEFGEPFDDGQAKTRAAVVPRGRGVDLREGLEQSIHAIGGDADAGIVDLDVQLEDALEVGRGGGGQAYVALV